jgi:8-oxo-dGTP pyrophosphatase MutT (NUDIX family)
MLTTVGIQLPPGAINEGPPVTPRPSATVILVRGGRPWELLLVRRPGGADFAPGAYVFPGGTVHGDDSSWPDEIRGAAVRELFEEAGILLGRRAGRLVREPDCESVRSLIGQGATFSQALRRLGLEPAFDRLVLLARWVTPALMSRRYDARFYVARLPAGQAVRPQEGEVTGWLWSSAGRALNDPEITLVYATRAVLESVATAGSASAVISQARSQSEVPIVEPRMVRTGSGWEIVR